MAEKRSTNPLPPCPFTLNCVRTSRIIDKGIVKVFEVLLQVFKKEAHSYKVIDPKRIEIHAVYRIPFLGFKDDVDVILEEANGATKIFIRSTSRIGNFDFGVNKRRIRRILKNIDFGIKN